MRQARLLLADEDTLFMEGLRKLLEPRFEVVGTVEDGQALVEAAKRLKPDVILLEISLPLLNGMDAARLLRRDLPGAKLAFVTVHNDPTYVGEALQAGALGYVLKRGTAAELLSAVHEVVRGRTYVTPLAVKGAAGRGIPAGESFGNLTGREREVLQLVAAGHSVKKIADGIAERWLP